MNQVTPEPMFDTVNLIPSVNPDNRQNFDLFDINEFSVMLTRIRRLMHPTTMEYLRKISDKGSRLYGSTTMGKNAGIITTVWDNGISVEHEETQIAFSIKFDPLPALPHVDYYKANKAVEEFTRIIFKQTYRGPGREEYVTPFVASENPVGEFWEIIEDYTNYE